MVKITVNNPQPERKLVAVIGCEGNSLFIPSEDGNAFMQFDLGCVSETRKSLKKLVQEHSDRQPIYEGDSITIQF